MRSVTLVAAGLAALAACGPKVHMDPMPFEQDDPSAGGAPTAAAPPGAHDATDVAPAAPPRPTAPPGRGTRTGVIARAALNAVLDAGPGAFLHGFEVAPVMAGQRFAGWRLVQLMEGEHRFDGLDVAPGDVLLSVNGLPVSKPDQLAAVWEQLRAANQLVIALVRDHAGLELRFAIDPPVASTGAAAAAPASVVP